MSFTYIDLFAGAGGLSEGFIREGFSPISHVEIDEAACYTLKTRTAYHYLKQTNNFHNYLSYLQGNISRNQLYELIPKYYLESIINKAISKNNNADIFEQIDNLIGSKKIDLIIGGPPCQAYSLVGRARSENNMKGDERNYLYVEYAKYLEKYNPQIFVFENVIGLKSAGKGVYLANMEKLFLKKSYNIKLYTIEAKNCGVLQSRRRVIIIGWKRGMNLELPNLEKISNNTTNTVTALFEDLPPLKAGEGKDKYMHYINPINDYLEYSKIRNGINIVTQHVTRPHTDQDKDIYKIAIKLWNEERKRLSYNDLPLHLKTHKNTTSFVDRFKVVAGNLPFSQTIVAHIAKDGHYYIHPDIEQNRSLSVREAARLQSFPDDYYFEGVKEGSNRTAAFKQIGNAVPPLMAQTIAKEIKKLLCQQV